MNPEAGGGDSESHMSFVCTDMWMELLTALVYCKTEVIFLQ